MRGCVNTGAEVAFADGAGAGDADHVLDRLDGDPAEQPDQCPDDDEGGEGCDELDRGELAERLLLVGDGRGEDQQSSLSPNFETSTR